MLSGVSRACSWIRSEDDRLLAGRSSQKAEDQSTALPILYYANEATPECRIHTDFTNAL
jgi:hypothetical protein